MDVSIISVESIRSSLPMLHNLKPFKLSFLDQLYPASFSPMVLFYPLNDPRLMKATHISKELKRSLSKTLDLFYPLCGRVQDNLFIHDYYAGVPFTETRVKGRLSDFLQNPQLNLLNQLVPYEPFCLLAKESLPLVAFQANIFDCGGMAIGMSFSHKFNDGTTAGLFCKNWAANAKGYYNQVIQPNLSDASLVFPPFEPPIDVSFETLFFEKRRSNVRRFVFDANAIASLRDKAKSKVVENPTRVQALFAFIWKSEMAARRRVHNSPKPSVLIQAKNFRGMAKPSISRHAIGNLSWIPGTKIASTDMEMSDLVFLMKEALESVNSDFLHGSTCILEQLQGLGRSSGTNFNVLHCTSWNSLGAKDFDFGWGKPIWGALLGEISPTHFSYPNTMILKQIEGSKSSAMEAWIILEEEVMDVLEKDPEFLAFASPNPAILNTPQYATSLA